MNDILKRAKPLTEDEMIGAGEWVLEDLARAAQPEAGSESR